MSGYEEYGEHTERPSSNFWKFACGGCLLVVMLFVVACIVIWYSLKRWDVGESAWERMPPSTYLAVEVHDLKSVFSQGLKDPGLRSLLNKTSRRLEDIMAETSGQGQQDFARSLNEMVETMASAESFFTMLAPNIATVGACTVADDDDDAIFVFFRPPMWMRISIDVSADGSIETIEESGSDVLYIFTMEGWVVIATTRELAEEILAHWDARALPLGPGPGSREAYLSLAVRAAPEAGQPAVASPPADADNQPGATGPSVMFNNPFSSDGGEPAEAGGEKTGDDDPFAARFILYPVGNGWTVHGELRGADSVLSSALPELVKQRFPGEGGYLAPSPDTEVEGVLKAAPEVVAAEKRRLEELSRTGVETGDDRREAFWAWLYAGWLANADGDIALSGKKPVAGYADGVPPLPVFTAAWRVTPPLDAEGAARQFGDSFAAMLEAMARNDDSPLASAVRDSIVYAPRDDAEGPGGMVTIPPVIANSARPTWRFPVAASPAMGLLSSDPSGITAKLPDWNALPVPAAKQVRARLSWNMSSDFREGLYACVKDRLETMPAFTEEDDDTLENLELLRNYFTAFPRGGVEVLADREAKQCVFQTTIPTGVHVDW